MRERGGWGVSSPSVSAHRSRPRHSRLSTSVASHPLGPNGRFVDRFLDRVSAMTPADVDATVTAWRESQHAPRDWATAEEAAATALVRTDRGEAAWC